MNSEQLTVGLFSGLMIVVVGWRTWATARKQGSVRGQTSMLWSFYALYAMGVIVFGGAALEFFFLGRPRRWGLAVAGIGLYIVAQLIRAAAVRTLGRYWSLHIEIRQQQPLVREGPYRYVRHPAYAAFILEHIAVPLAGGAWWSLAAVGLGYVPLLLWRARREEVELVKLLGEPYQAFQREVGMLVPRLAAVQRSQPSG